MIDSDDPDAMRAFIEGAEQYFRDLDRPQVLFDKPYYPAKTAGYNVARLGYLLAHLKHGPRHTVLDFGAGMGWLSIVLARSGCRVIALDVSPTATRLAEEAVRDANLPASQPRPTFLTYDGFRFPLDDNSVDRVACYDALHHVPNKKTVLGEIFRVLRPGGRACFVEPGPGHSASDEAVHDSDRWGVLEDEIDAGVLSAMASDAGFVTANIVPLLDPSENCMDPSRFREVCLGGRESVLGWKGNDALLVFVKGGVADSRAPDELKAAIELLEMETLAAPRAAITARLRVTNTGNTRWLALPPATAGAALDYAAAFLDKHIVSGEFRNLEPVGRYRRWVEGQALEGRVTLGAQLWDLRFNAVIDHDYARGFLSRDLDPGQHDEISVRMRAPAGAGLYGVKFDLVDEYVTWFGSDGSPVELEYLNVMGDTTVADSRIPGRLDAHLRVLEHSGKGSLVVAIENRGDTVWLRGPMRRGGHVQLGVQRLDAAGTVAQRDWLRVPLPRTVAPGESARLRVDLESSGRPTPPAVRLDLLCEMRYWFSEHGCVPLDVSLAART
ncbi:MAG: class I SAM-dependent methyltransferase [Acidobacteriota bacterium]